MRNPVLIIIFLLTVTPIRAQQMISVIDTDTREPVPYAAFTQNGDTLAYTTLVGIAMVPKVSGKILLTCKTP